MVQKKRHRPKLGQHFLADSNYRRRIADTLALEPGDCLLEIGAGAGAMTPLLAARARNVVAVELDEDLIRRLEDSTRALSNIETLHADILHLDIAALCRRLHVASVFAFGNIPYYITSPIIHHLLRSAASLRGMALLMQKEVADRVVAAPGSRHYGYLTVAVQLAAEARIALRVPRGAFSPPPDVESALVTFRMIRPPLLPEPEWAGFLKFAMQCFGQKRKSLMNNLASSCSRSTIEASLAGANLSPAIRAEQVSAEDLIRLFHALS